MNLVEYLVEGGYGLVDIVDELESPTLFASSLTLVVVISPLPGIFIHLRNLKRFMWGGAAAYYENRADRVHQLLFNMSHDG